MTELDVVNEQLASMAEAPVTTLNIAHPYIASGLSKLAVASQSIQATRWWFNVIELEVTPTDTTWLIDDQLPCGTFSVWSKDPTKPVTWRDGQLLSYDTYEAVQVPTWIVVHFEVPFNDLPVTANLAVAAKAIYDFQRSYDSDSTKASQLKEDAKEKLAMMTAEHMRVRKTNLLARDSTAYSRFRVRGTRPWVVN